MRPLAPAQICAARPTFLAWLAALALVAMMAPRASAFEVFRHANLTQEVLARQGLTGSALGFVVDGAQWPDIQGCVSECYCPTWLQVVCTPPSDPTVLVLSESHFDNNRIDQSAQRVTDLVSQSYGTLSSLSLLSILNPVDWYNCALALNRFGQALHTVQDFYAHSTWIECWKDLVRISGNLEDIPLWQGEGLDCSAVVGSVTIGGLQTGFVELATPAGSVTHDQLNKDKPSSAEGAVQIRRVFPSTLVATYYEAASGQLGGTLASYQDIGVAPRHTIVALQAVLTGGSVYNLFPPSKQAQSATDQRSSTQKRADIMGLLARANAEPYFADMAAASAALWASYDTNDPTTFPFDQFDPNGLPVAPTDVPSDPIAAARRLFAQNVPNPFNPATTFHFRVPTDGPVRLRIYDAHGALVRTLAEGPLPAGPHDMTWNGTDDRGHRLPSGVYLVHLDAAGHSETRKVVLAK